MYQAIQIHHDPDKDKNGSSRRMNEQTRVSIFLCDVSCDWVITDVEVFLLPLVLHGQPEWPKDNVTD